jgi:DNA replication protein DnaC
LDNFVWDAVRPPALRTHVEQFLTEIEAAVQAPHLLLTGAPGLGKTHIGVGIYRWAVARFGTMLATWLNVPVFCDQVKTTYTSTDTRDLFADYAEARRLVVLDDLFGRDLTAHEAGQVVYRLLDTAYQNGAAVLVTMNKEVEELPARLPQHETSRLLAQATIIPLKGDRDWRQRG